jgi:uncharacterized protein YoxC
MDNQFLLYIMTAFVVIAGISLLLQLGMIFGIYKTAKATEEKVTALLPKVTALIDVSTKTIEHSRVQITEIAEKAGAIADKTNEILDSTKRQVAKIEDVVNDASGRAKVQLERAEMVLDDTMSRAHETVAKVHGGITRPLREIHGIAAGVKTALSHLANGGRPSVAQATHDDEMFI